MSVLDRLARANEQRVGTALSAADVAELLDAFEILAGLGRVASLADKLVCWQRDPQQLAHYADLERRALEALRAKGHRLVSIEEG